MSLPIRLTPQAREDLRAARRWYNDQRRGLGIEFIREVDACLASIQRFPEAFALIQPPIRRVPVRRFPYVVLYAIGDEEVIIVGVLHGRRSPETWRSRLPDS